MTPYDDDFATCETTYAELRVYSGSIAPSEVTLQLGLQPSSEAVAGRVIANSIGISRTEKLNGWFLSSYGVVESKDLRTHLDWLIEQLLRVRSSLKNIQLNPEIKMTVQCIWWSKNGDGGPVMWPKQMRSIADLDLELSLSVSDYSS